MWFSVRFIKYIEKASLGGKLAGGDLVSWWRVGWWRDYLVASNLVPRVFRLFGQRGNAGKTLGTSNFITAGFLR